MQVKLVILRITDLCLIFAYCEPLKGPSVKKIISCDISSGYIMTALKQSEANFFAETELYSCKPDTDGNCHWIRYLRAWDFLNYKTL